MLGAIPKDRPFWLLNERPGIAEAEDRSPPRRPRRLPRIALSLVLALALCVYIWKALDLLPLSKRNDGASSQQEPASQNTRSFSWHKILPSTVLEYHPCYDGFECARLSVPMEWQEEGEGPQVAVAFVRLPAKVPVTDPRYGGPVLINPGGPGGSGIQRVLNVGQSLQFIVDSERNPASATSNDESPPLYHDIIGFDPRGVGETTPSISCFPDALSRENWLMQNEALGILGSSTDTYSFQQHWYRARALAEGCSSSIITTSNDTSSIGEHLNTTPVMRDMLEIIEQHAHWSGKTSSETHCKLKYWGFSYGTVIGQTFAAMYPDKVERMVLDGVCDSEDYYNGDWFSNLADADHILERFFSYCDQAGPDKCQFYTTGGPPAIRKVYDKLIHDIFTIPLSVPASITRGPDVITWSDVKSMVRLGMYQPLQYLELVASLLADVAHGNGSAFADFKAQGHTLSCPSLECKDAGPFSPECNPAGVNGLDSAAAILCSDGELLGDVNEERFQEYWHALQNQSKVMGDWWAHNRLACVGWKAKAKWRFSGPFAANTSHPILWISNTLDPVTPIHNARRMAPSYPGSVILQQEAEGHCSFAAPSLCTARTVRAYFQTGVLPKPGTVCPADVKPLVGAVEGVAALDARDWHLMEAMWKVSKAFGDEARWRQAPFF